MTDELKEFFLNTPEKYWTVIFGYHPHKSFFSLVLIIMAIIVFFTYWLKLPSKHYLAYLGLTLFIIGGILLILSVLGHIYTQNVPYFKLWDKY